VTTRVIQWATGAIGLAELRAVIDDPNLDLVGRVPSPTSRASLRACWEPRLDSERSRRASSLGITSPWGDPLGTPRRSHYGSSGRRRTPSVRQPERSECRSGRVSQPIGGSIRALPKPPLGIRWRHTPMPRITSRSARAPNRDAGVASADT
jgi:hypothetical protein